MAQAAPIEHRIEVRYCVPDDQEHLLPSRRRAPQTMPLEAPIPRQGEVIYLSSSSAWTVSLVIHEWRGPKELRVELWLEHLGSSRYARPAGFELTQ